jgi:putative colanic acid biosynthesis acetyltransferase WcaF
MTPSRIFQQLDRSCPAPYRLSEYARKFAWKVIGQPLVRLSPRPFRRFRIWVLRAFGAKIAASANIRSSAIIWHPWLLSLGEYSCIGDQALIYNLGPVQIGDHTLISQRVHVCNGSHDHRIPNLPLIRPTCVIGSGVWICADAFIGPGVTIGDNSLVAAAAVVVRPVAPGTIVGGNPAVVIKSRSLDPAKGVAQDD